jgi:hypothetical protein
MSGHGRWQLAADLLPWLSLRLAGGCALTLLGSWMLIERTPSEALARHLRWTAWELALAVPAILMGGALGLAIAGAVTVWLGLHGFFAACTATLTLAQRRRLRLRLFNALLMRPSLLVALALAIGASLQPALLLLLPLAWLSEPRVRARLRHRPTPTPAHG